jgi:hypothetical protein
MNSDQSGFDLADIRIDLRYSTMVNVIVFHAASCLGPQGWFAGSARGVGNPYLGIILGLPVIRSV